MTCAGEEYHNMARLGWAVVVVVGLGSPAFLFFLVRNIRTRSGVEAANFVFQFLTGNFIPTLWYWEMVLMVRKLVGIIVLTLPTQVQLQGLFLYYIACGFLQYAYTPYSISHLNRLELVSLSVAVYAVNAMMAIKGLQDVDTTSGDANSDWGVMKSDVGPAIYNVLIYSVVIAYSVAIVAAFVFIYRYVKQEMRNLKQQKSERSLIVIHHDIDEALLE